MITNVRFGQVKSMKSVYRLDSGISDKWYEWRDDLQKLMDESFEIPPEEAMNYDPYA